MVNKRKKGVNKSVNLFTMQVLSFIPILIVINLVSTAPTEEKEAITLYNSLSKNCEVIKTQTDFQNQKIFTICSDWKDIIDTSKSLVYDLSRALTCKLYFNSFTNYCKGLEKITVPKTSDLSLDVYQNTTILCENLSKKLLALPGWKLDDFKNQTLCKHLCLDYNTVEVVEACKLSYFYLNAISLLKPQESSQQVNIKDDTNVPKKSVVPTPQLLPLKTKSDPAVAQPTVKKTNKQKEVDQADSNINPAPADQAQAPSQLNDEQEAEEEVSNIQKILKKEPEVSKPDDIQSNKDITKVTEKTQQSQQQISNENTQKSPSTKVTETNKVADTVDQQAVIKSKVPDKPVVDAKPVNVDDKVNKQQEPKNKVDTAGDQRPIDDENNDNVYDEEDKINVKNEDSDFNAGVPFEPLDSINLKQMKHSDMDFSDDMDGNSYFFSYFMVICVLFVFGYVVYHNKQKIMALLVEGRQGKRQYRGRRPNSANYHKLDSNLEEAISSNCSKNTTHVIY